MFCVIRTDDKVFKGSKLEIIEQMMSVSLTSDREPIIQMRYCYPITLSWNYGKEWAREEAIKDIKLKLFNEYLPRWGYKIYTQV